MPASALKEELPEQFAVGRLEGPYMILYSCKNRFLGKPFHICCGEAQVDIRGFFLVQTFIFFKNG